MSQRKLSDALLPFFVLSFLSLLGICSALRARARAEDAPCPAPDPGQLWSGAWQSGFSEWLTTRFAGYDLMLRTRNQLLYSVFNEASGNWLVGKKKYLFSKSQSYDFVTDDRTWIPFSAEFDSYAEKVAAVQSRLEQLGKQFVFILTPYKAELYTDCLPWNYRILAKRYADGGGKNTAMEKLVAAFRRHGVFYYDVTDDLRAIERRGGEFPAFYKTAHHWSLSAAAEILPKIFARVKERYPGFEEPRLCVAGQDDALFRMDVDVLSIQRLFFGSKAKRYVSPRIVYDRALEKRWYLYGTSNGGEIYEALFRSQVNCAASRVVFQLYNVTRFEAGTRGESKEDFFAEGAFASYVSDISDCDFVMVEQGRTAGVMETHEKFFDYLRARLDALSPRAD